MNIGDHLVTPRTGYTHHGLYIGDDQVIHYAGFTSGLSKGKISVTSLTEFCNGRSFRVKEHPSREYGAKKSVKRAYSRLGEDWYNVLINNCEHFVNWCIEGRHSSSQVNTAIAALAVTYAAKKYMEEDATTQSIQAAASLATRHLVGKEASRQATQAIAPGLARALVSTSAGTAAGAGLASYGTGTVIASGIIAASSATVLLPAAVAIGVGAAVWNWLSD